MAQMDTFVFEAGRALWSDVRIIVKREQIDDETMTLNEGHGFLSRLFFVSGSLVSVGRVRRAINRFRYDTIAFDAPRASWKTITDIAQKHDVLLRNGFGIFNRRFTLSGHPDAIYGVLGDMFLANLDYTRKAA
jgi:hypothetical protein